MLDLHRHDEFSNFDGFGKATYLAKLAKKKGYTALGIANHGNTSGLVEHYFSCKEAGIKPILGVEAYFQPVFNKDKPRYHLCLFAKNLEGYQNINRIMTIANEKYFYYKPNVTFKLLEQYNEGIICTSACIAGFISYALAKNNSKVANKAIKKFKEIYGDDFYIEIQPYKLSDKGLQESTNIKLIKLAKKYDVKCILTSDSHYGDKADFPTYLKMHEIAGTKYDIGATYGERYMPDKLDLAKRFTKMHKNDFSKKRLKKLVTGMYDNLVEIENKIEDEILEKLELKIPYTHKNAKKILQREIVKGLKAKNRHNKKYIERCKKEFEIIVHHGFEDYFLIVQDYVKWAKNNNIAVGPGRGSVCNCLVAYALDITDVDPVYFDLQFTRFLRKDKKKLPDIDLDFETDRRQEVIEYIVNKYDGKAVQICSYGLYKVDNLLNDLCKVCNVDDDAEKTEIKKYVKRYIDKIDGRFDYDTIKNSNKAERINYEFDNILDHFDKMYKQVKFLGTHAAGVAVVNDNIINYTALRKTRNIFTSSYDLNNLEKINAIKFDILGLRTVSMLKELQELTGMYFDYNWLDDEKVKAAFKAGNTNGIFQFEKETAQNILREIQADCIEDVIAANALNRPGPLSLGMPEQYAENKSNVENMKRDMYYKYTKKTYGTVVYQEQITAICRGIGDMSWSDSDKVLKHLKGTQMTERAVQEYEKDHKYLLGEFIKGAAKNGLTKKQAKELFEKITVYSFNEGHSTGYTLISWQMMWYKIHYPIEFWYVCMKYASNERDLVKYKIDAVKDGNVIFLPHVNGGAEYAITEFDDQEVLQEGLTNIKHCGKKAAEFIVNERKKNGKYKSKEDFLNRIQKRTVNSRVVSVLEESGALEFDKNIYINRVTKYNSTLYMKGMNK